ncbi:MAG: ABC transporter permease [Gammaproteobacteria bacterium]|nr:ABC transporter permease [Gammaproteobacteria bacterium]
MNNNLPWWFHTLALPAVNILLALTACAVVLLVIDVNIVEAARIMFIGALGNQEGIGYTLFYATNFMFTGLAVALAWHAGLFNIGAEGQATLGGLGVAMICATFGDSLPFGLLVILTTLSAAFFGALWAFIPGWLNAYRGSHIVISTIMFNFIASSLLVFLLVNVFRQPDQMAAVSQTFGEQTWLPYLDQLFKFVGGEISRTPLNISFLWAVFCCFLVHYYLFHTRFGYETRGIGFNHRAGAFAGIDKSRVIIVTMALAGALAGFVGLNEIQGSSHQLKVEFVAGYGFAGIAVALIGRNHPLGIIAASILFGALYQGGSELAFNIDRIGNDIVLLIQGLVILFCGALEWMVKPKLIALFSGSPKQPVGDSRG